MPVKGKAENKMLQKKKKNQGFTLVELIVVIVIILILAAVAVPSITRCVQKSKIAKCANQRHELATQFQIMGTDVPELALCTLEGEVENILKKDVLNYMIENGYCSQDITVCPVYNEKYELEISVENGQQHVEFVCQCVDSVKGYVSTCSKYYNEIIKNGNENPDRKDLLSKVADEKGFMKVSDSIKSSTLFKDKPLYWKPYFLADGTMALYGTTNSEGENAWSNWNAYLIYYNGQVYQSTKKNGTKPTNGNIASMNGIKKETMEEYLKNHDFEKVEK